MPSAHANSLAFLVSITGGAAAGCSDPQATSLPCPAPTRHTLLTHTVCPHLPPCAGHVCVPGSGSFHGCQQPPGTGACRRSAQPRHLPGKPAELPAWLCVAQPQWVLAPCCSGVLCGCFASVLSCGKTLLPCAPLPHRRPGCGRPLATTPWRKWWWAGWWAAAARRPGTAGATGGCCRGCCSSRSSRWGRCCVGRWLVGRCFVGGVPACAALGVSQPAVRPPHPIQAPPCTWWCSLLQPSITACMHA